MRLSKDTPAPTASPLWCTGSSTISTAAGATTTVVSVVVVVVVVVIVCGSGLACILVGAFPDHVDPNFDRLDASVLGVIHGLKHITRRFEEDDVALAVPVRKCATALDHSVHGLVHRGEFWRFFVRDTATVATRAEKLECDGRHGVI